MAAECALLRRHSLHREPLHSARVCAFVLGSAPPVHVRRIGTQTESAVPIGRV